MTEEQGTILIIDDRDDLMEFCQRVLSESFRFRHVSNARDAEPFLREGGIAAALVDRDFSKGDRAKLLGPASDIRNEGLHIVRWLRREFPALPVLMVTGFREQGPALETAEMGVDFLAWEDVIEDPDILRARLTRALETPEMRAGAILSSARELGVVAESASMVKVVEALGRAIPTGKPILLLGETGVGKDFLAFVVHALTGDSMRPFVTVDVGAITPSLVPDELFGHKRGAFTTAHEATPGKMRFASGGTLFINEIGDLTPESQVQFRSAVERSEVVPVGGVESYPVDFRLITATNRDLGAMVERGEFRLDLYHRLAWHTIVVPPLRERREDIPALIRVFLRAAGQGTASGTMGIVKEAVDYLCGLPWPGNVRELQAVVAHAGAVARHIITLADVREAASRIERLGPAVGDAHGADPTRCEQVVFGDLTYEQVTERYFHFLYRTTHGNLRRLGELASIAKSTVYAWRDKYATRPGESGDTPETS
jgi:DNA-binding NtrC family response regulator